MKTRKWNCCYLVVMSLIFFCFIQSKAFGAVYTIELDDLTGTYYADHRPSFESNFNWDVEFAAIGGQTQVYDFGEPIEDITKITLTYEGNVSQWPTYSSSGSVRNAGLGIVRGWGFRHVDGIGTTWSRGWSGTMRANSGEINVYDPDDEHGGLYSSGVYRNVLPNGDFVWSFISDGGWMLLDSDLGASGIVEVPCGFWVTETYPLLQSGIINVTSVTLTIETASVPIPSAFFLFGPSLTGLLWLRRKNG